MRLVLHIGSTKTGSSALQWTLHARRSALLAEANALYPDRGIASSAHHLLAAAIHPGAWRLHADALPQDRAAYFEDTAAAIRADAGATGAGTIVLSSEYLWGSFPPRLYRTFREAFPDASVEIVAFLRRQDEWAISSYLQAVKSGEGRAFGEWTALNLLRRRSGPPLLPHRQARWAHFLDAHGAWARPALRRGAPIHGLRPRSASGSAFGRETDFEVARRHPSPSTEGPPAPLEVNRSRRLRTRRRGSGGRRDHATHRSDRASAETTLLTDPAGAGGYILRTGPINRTGLDRKRRDS